MRRGVGATVRIGTGGHAAGDPSTSPQRSSDNPAAIFGGWCCPASRHSRDGVGTSLAATSGVSNDHAPWGYGSPLLVILACTFISGGCYTTQSRAFRDSGALNQPGHRREFLLRTGDRHEVRIRPSSWLRFRGPDDGYSEWVEASDLRVTPTFVVAGRTSEGEPLILSWNDIAGVEVNDLDVGRTVLGVVGGTTAVVVALAADILVISAVACLTDGRARVDPQLTAGVVDALADAAHERPQDEPASSESVVSAHVPFGAEILANAQPLFSGEARRRDVVRMGVGVESGFGFSAGRWQPQTAFVGTLRLWNVFELGAGVAMFGISGNALAAADVPLDASADPSGISRHDSLRLEPSVRVGFHFDLDDRRRIALYIGQDVAFGQSGLRDFRTIWGARVRISDRWQVGIYPANPRASGTLGTTQFTHAYVSGLELAWMM